MAYRYYDYASQKAELFMLDFCYFINLSVICQTAFYPDNLMWFKAGVLNRNLPRMRTPDGATVHNGDWLMLEA